MYQPDAYNIPYSNHYPNHYPSSVSTIPTPLSYFPFQQQLQVKTEPTPPEPPEPVVTPKVASKAIERLILLELQHAGFESAEKSTVNRLELEVSTCMLLALLDVGL
jgi:transcription initiation factor TFIID subunit 8